jgi:serine/threonine protein kinase
MITDNDNICLVDFGSVVILPANQWYTTRFSPFIGIDAANICHDNSTRILCGTYHYYAPEMIATPETHNPNTDGNPIILPSWHSMCQYKGIAIGYDRRIDWWALGCLLFEMFTGY